MKILCVCHNTPFPPNKGDKMRSYHLLRGLAAEHEVHLLTLAKDPKDLQYRTELEAQFASVTMVALTPWLSKLYALICLCTFLPLTLGFFFSFRARRAVKALAGSHDFDATLAFCSSTAHYVASVPAPIRLVDFVDIDSEKWGQYARIHSLPKSFIYALEQRRLSRLERRIHQKSTHSIVTSEIEKKRLMVLTGDCGSRIVVIPQGINLGFYAQRKQRPQPKRLVFTGQMDYLPNVDGVLYFYQQVYPLLKASDPDIEFYIVGRNASAELAALCPEAVITGEVEDIRDFLHTAAIVIAPLRLAFGMQSKILEAMASTIPVVASDKAAQSLWAIPDEALLVAGDTEEFAAQILYLLANPQQAKAVAAAGRRYVEARHQWSTIIKSFLKLLRDDAQLGLEIDEAEYLAGTRADYKKAIPAEPGSFLR